MHILQNASLPVVFIIVVAFVWIKSMPLVRFYLETIDRQATEQKEHNKRQVDTMKVICTQLQEQTLALKSINQSVNDLRNEQIRQGNRLANVEAKIGIDRVELYKE